MVSMQDMVPSWQKKNGFMQHWYGFESWSGATVMELSKPLEIAFRVDPPCRGEHVIW